MLSRKKYSKINSPKHLDKNTQLGNELQAILHDKINKAKLQNRHVSPPPSPPAEKSLSYSLTLPPPMQYTEGHIPYTHFVSKKPDGTLVSESALGLTKRKRRKTKRAVRSHKKRQFPRRKTKRRKTKGKKTKRR